MSMYLSKKSNIPGTSKSSNFGIMNTNADSEIPLLLNSKKLGTNTLQVSGSNYYDPDSISLIVCALVFIGMIVVGMFVALIVNYKTRVILDNLKHMDDEQTLCKDIELGNVNETYNNSIKEIDSLKNSQNLDKNIYGLLHINDIFKHHNVFEMPAQNFTKQERSNVEKCYKITNSDMTISNTTFSKKVQSKSFPNNSNSYHIDPPTINKKLKLRRLPNKDILSVQKLYNDMINGGLVCDKRRNSYSYSYISSINNIDDYESEINMKNFKNCPINILMQTFESKKEAMKNIKLINHYLFKRKIPLNEKYTVEILLFKLVSMLANATENGYCYQKDFCKGMQDFFNKGIISEYFFAIENYLLQDCLVGTFLDYFQGHCMFPYLGNTSFIHYTFQKTNGFQVEDIYSESFIMIITMFLNFQMLFENKNRIYHDALETSHNEYISKKLNKFLDYYLCFIAKTNSNTYDETSYVVNQVIDKLLNSVKIMEEQKNMQYALLYLQSILQIYTKHQACCLKDSKPHISLKTNENVYDTIANILNTLGTNNHLIIQVMKSFRLVSNDHEFLEKLHVKIEEVINKENHQNALKAKVEKHKNKKTPLKIQSGSWNI